MIVSRFGQIAPICAHDHELRAWTARKRLRLVPVNAPLVTPAPGSRLREGVFMIADSFGRIRAKTARDHGVPSPQAAGKGFGATKGAGLA